MIVHFHRDFIKRYNKLQPQLRRKTDRVLCIFRESPFAPSLRNHQLQGTMHERRAISVTDDIRIIYETIDQHITVLVLDVGNHDQVY